MERLQKIIADSGYCSRRKAEDLIRNGQVEVNGVKVTQMGFKTNYDDDITIDGHSLSLKEDKVYYLLNKPRGVITSVSDDKKRKTVVDLIDTNKRIYPVGRLDYDTTGALLLTNDGYLTNLLIHPRHHVEKFYIAKIEGIPTKKQLNTLASGVLIDGKKTSMAKVKLRKIDKKNNTSVIDLIIYEGKNHQVKKMFEAIGYKVLKLRRESFAFLTVDHLNSGEYRELTIKEVKQLYSLASKNEKR